MRIIIVGGGGVGYELARSHGNIENAALSRCYGSGILQPGQSNDRQFSVKKINCEVMKPHYVPVSNTLGIDSLISPRLLAAAQVMRFIRREDVVALSILRDEKAEIVKVVLPQSAKAVNRKIADAGLPSGMLISSVIRNGDVLVPNGNTVLRAKDHLVIFAIPEVSAKLDRYFAAVEGNGDRDQLRNRLFLAEQHKMIYCTKLVT